MVDNRSINYMIHAQSNGAGNVDVTEIASDLKRPLLNCNILNLNTKQSEVLQAGINSYGVREEYWNQFRTLPSTGRYYGIEVELSRLLRDHYNATINLFKHTWPGAGLNTTSQGGNYAFSNGNLMPLVAEDYAHYRSALKVTENERFLVWIQGESNASASAATYKTNIKTWIDAYRVVLGFNIPLIVVTLSSQQTNISATNFAAFKAMQLTLGGTVYNHDGTFTTQAAYIDNCYVLNQDEGCQNEGGIYIHYGKTGITNIANSVFQIVKNKIIL
jgi:hypothetical protein